jgi:hypothetical protein
MSTLNFIDEIIKTMHHIAHPQSELPDISLETIYAEILQVLKSITKNNKDIHRISEIKQRTKEWHGYRKHLLTASNFGECSHNTRSFRIVDRILFPRDISYIPAVKWGITHESDASNLYEEYHKVRLMYVWKEYFMLLYGLLHQNIKNIYISNTIIRVLHFLNNDIEIIYPGLTISRKYNFLACSPDGLVLSENNERIGLEIKCPYSQKFYTPIPFKYYDQIQGTMNLLKFKYYDFVTWIPDGKQFKIQIERFKPDTMYWENYLFPKLSNFYFFKIVPFIVMQNLNIITNSKITSINSFEIDF